MLAMEEKGCYNTVELGIVTEIKSGLASPLFSVQERSVKNHTDVLIFYTQICAGASQICLMADANWICVAPSLKRSGMESVMSKRETYEEKTECLLTPIVEQYGVEIYDVEYVKEGKDYYLRVYIDKPEGVNIQDCENVSRALSDALDAEDFIPDAYILEVSSPGLGRVLKKDRHMEKSLGETVELKAYKPMDGQKEFSGILKAFDDRTVTIEQDGVLRTFERSDIATVRLALDI